MVRQQAHQCAEYGVIGVLLAEPKGRVGNGGAFMPGLASPMFFSTANTAQHIADVLTGFYLSS